MYIKTLTVSNLNGYIKKIFDNDFILKNIKIKGELSNFKWHDNGNIYFSLKDESSKINCIMFKNNAYSLNFMPKDGMSVILKGRISVYLKEGTYQLYCEEIELDGVGELYASFEKLKKKLEYEGIFNEKHKLPIPKYCKNIGVITAPTGAAIHDVINVVNRRNKKINISIYPSLVQGINASKNVIEGIKKFNKLKNVDVIIIARGGGSIEELWAFNDEELAYEIYKSKIPIVTGVGHETDFTIVDFVSDRRAPTPSAAAEIVTTKFEDLKNEILRYREYFDNYIMLILNNEFQNLKLFEDKIRLNNPTKKVEEQNKYLASLKKRLDFIVTNNLKREEIRLENINKLILSKNPIGILNKGYSIIQNNNGTIIKKVDDLKKCESIKVILSDGKVKLKVESLN